jgi:hypothetical protein
MLLGISPVDAGCSTIAPKARSLCFWIIAANPPSSWVRTFKDSKPRGP